MALSVTCTTKISVLINFIHEGMKGRIGALRFILVCLILIFLL